MRTTEELEKENEDLHEAYREQVKAANGWWSEVVGLRDDMKILKVTNEALRAKLVTQKADVIAEIRRSARVSKEFGGNEWIYMESLADRLESGKELGTAEFHRNTK